MRAWSTVEILPVVHGSMEFASVVRRVMAGRRFDKVALELPATLKKPVLDGARRLPALSVVHYESEGRPVYLLVEPTSPLFEAARTALEMKLPVELIDLDVDDAGRVAQPLPDTYAVGRIGCKAYCEAYLRASASSPGSHREVDERRERAMAYHLQRMSRNGEKVLCVCGLEHAGRLVELLETVQVQPFGKVRRKGVKLSHLDAGSCREVATEPAYLRHRYEQWRREVSPEAEGDAPEADELIDRLRAQEALYAQAAGSHREKSGCKVSGNLLGVAIRFSRNWALLEGGLAPCLYKTVVAARGVADDDFALEVWELATRAVEQERNYDLPELELSLQDLDRSGRLVRFRRRLRRRRKVLRALRPRAKESYPGQWRDSWKPGAICSYPPEDLVIESYGGLLKKKARRILSEESASVEPFVVSLGDGIDVRETIRRWHEGRIYVRHKRPVRGKVGAVLIVFDPDDQGPERYPWKLTWQGENTQESDMAFYATPIAERFVGPGISRSEYGGFLMTYPPGRMFGVWQDPYFDLAETKPERLLLAALDYCLDEMIVYVGQSPPKRKYLELAKRYGNKLIYIPIGQLAPDALERIRIFHVLADHRVRDYAGDYLK